MLNSMTGWAKVAAIATCLVLAALSFDAQAQNICDGPGDVPDVIVGDLHELNRNGSVGGITAFSVGTYSCNIGTCWLDWFENSVRHPVIGANLFRLRNGRFEQLGQSWLKHGFFALSDNLCNNGCQSTNGQHLGVNCADPYSAGLNGQQSNLGPKWEVNASSGAFIWPFATRGVTGNSIYKRLQVKNTDLDPAQNSGALYFLEGTYIHPDDAVTIDSLPDANGDGFDDFDTQDNSANNSSYRRVTVSVSSGNYFLNFAAPTVRTLPAIYAWQTADPFVVIDEVTVPGDGRYFVGSKVTDLGNGTWQYEYAVYNHTSHRSGGSFSVNLPWGVNLSNISFKDVDYHSQNSDGSGSYYDPTDWAHNGGQGSVLRWTVLPSANPDRDNALRWGTLYNFRFVADAPPSPGPGGVVIGLWAAGSPESISAKALVPTFCDGDGVCDPNETCGSCPSDCNNQGGGGGCCGDGVCNAGESSCTCFADCGPPDTVEFFCNDGEDNDCDGLTDCSDFDCCSDGACSGPDNDGDGYEQCDCNDANPNVWAAPGEVEDLLASHGPGGTTLSWTAPLWPGANSITYETIRTSNVLNFLTSTSCLPDGNPTDTTILDAAANPAPGAVYFYEVRAVNACPAGDGPLGRASSNLIREGRSCP